MEKQTKRTVFELKVVVEQELGLLESLLEQMQIEREALLEFKPDQLVELNKRKELLILQLNYLEENRLRVSARIAKALDIPEPDKATLAIMAEHIDDPISEDLRRLHSKFIALVESIQELNTINRDLIEFSIRSVKGSVAFLKRRFFHGETYSSSGVVNEEIEGLSRLSSRV